MLPLGRILFALAVVMPILGAAIYFGLVAADQYVAEFRFGLHSAEPVRPNPLVALQGGPDSVSALNSQIIVQYLESRAVVDELAGKNGLHRIFSRPEADWFARLAASASIEELVRYWRRQVDAFYEPGNGTVTVRVRAFTAQDAADLARALEAACERLVNELSGRARDDALRRSQQEAADAEERLKSALARLRAFRDKAGLIEPRKAAETTSALAARVRDELLRARAEQSTLRTYLKSDAPGIKVAEARIRSLEAELAALGREVAAHSSPSAPTEPLSGAISEYEQLDSERAFAERAYQHALDGLDRARIEAQRQQIYLETFVPPSLPEEALYPRRLLSFATVAAVALAVWSIGWFSVQAVKDHC